MHLGVLRILAVVENQFMDQQAASAEEDRAADRVAGEAAQAQQRDLSLDGLRDRERALRFAEAIGARV